MKTMTIKDKVEAATAELTGKTLKELYAWAEAHGINNRSAFGRFKAALKECGIADWDLQRDANAEARAERLAANVTHEVTLFVDAKAQHQRFAICGPDKEVAWYGIFFEDDQSFSYGDRNEQSACECAAARKAIWFASQIRNAACDKMKTLRLNLKVDANWLCTVSGKAAVLADDARRFNIELKVEWIAGTSNPADRWTTERGFKKWSGNDLASMAEIVGEPLEADLEVEAAAAVPAEK